MPIMPLAGFLRAFSLQPIWPPPEFAIDLVARVRSISRDAALRIMEANQRIRVITEDYLGREIGDEASIRQLFGKLSIDFGLSVSEADKLHPCLLAMLLTFIQRLKNATGKFEQDTLHQIADARSTIDREQYEPEAITVFLKALNRFPDPRPDTIPNVAMASPFQEPSFGQDMSPGSKVIYAATELKRAGKPVTLAAACRAAKVDRKNIMNRYKDAVAIVKTLATPDRDLRRGMSDARSGNLDAYDDGV